MNRITIHERGPLAAGLALRLIDPTGTRQSTACLLLERGVRKAADDAWVVQCEGGVFLDRSGHFKVGPWYLDCTLVVRTKTNYEFTFTIVPSVRWLENARTKPELWHTLLVLIVDREGITLIQDPRAP